MPSLTDLATAPAAGPRITSRDRVCSKVIEYGILGLLVLAPLPAASVYEWSILAIELVVLVMAGAYVVMKDKPRPDLSLMKSSKKLKPLFIGFLVFLTMQVTPLPKALVGLVSPGSADYLRRFGTDFSAMNWISFSLIPSYTLQRGLQIVTYLLLGFLVLRNVTKMRQVVRLYGVLLAVGVAQTIYGMVELYSKNPRILFYKKAYNLDSLTGTFVNRNHFSGYLEMIVPLAVGLIISRMGLFSQAGLTLRERIVRLSEQRNAKNLLAVAGLVVMALGIVFSKSRSGVFVLVFSFVLFFGLTSLDLGTSKLKKVWVRRFLRASFILIILFSLYIGIDTTMERFSLDRLLYEGRPTYWANALTTFGSFPLMGTGLGTFGALYPVLEGEGGLLRVEHAHNDYLEYLSELGLVGFVLLFGGLGAMAVISFLAWRRRRSPEVKGLGLGGIVAVIGILLHSLTDFNLQIPANQVLFSVILPLTMVISFHGRAAVSPEGK